MLMNWVVELLKIVINRDGSVEIDFINYRGEKCIQELDRIIEVLKSRGVKIVSKNTVLKPEYYVSEKTETRVRA